MPLEYREGTLVQCQALREPACTNPFECGPTQKGQIVRMCALSLCSCVHSHVRLLKSQTSFCVTGAAFRAHCNSEAALKKGAFVQQAQHGAAWRGMARHVAS